MFLSLTGSLLSLMNALEVQGQSTDVRLRLRRNALA